MVIFGQPLQAVLQSGDFWNFQVVEGSQSKYQVDSSPVTVRHMEVRAKGMTHCMITDWTGSNIKRPHRLMCKIHCPAGRGTDRFGVEVPDNDTVVLRAADDEGLAAMGHERCEQAMRIVPVPCVSRSTYCQPTTKHAQHLGSTAAT